MPRDRSSDSPKDEQLALRARQGCSASFEKLVRRYQTRLVNFLRQRTAVTADAEDLAQDTFVRAYENLHRYRDSGAFSTWLFTIARRLCINHGRKKRPQANSEALHSVESASISPEQAASNAETSRLLWEVAAETLNERQMTVLWLYYVEDMSVAQISPVVERSSVAVKMMLFRARKKLFPALEELDMHEPNGKKTGAAGNSPTEGALPQGSQECITTEEPGAEAASAEPAAAESNNE
jgi:RNA polymerase sigma-70 factor (ECF subfamily)